MNVRRPRVSTANRNRIEAVSTTWKGEERQRALERYCDTRLDHFQAGAAGAVAAAQYSLQLSAAVRVRQEQQALLIRFDSQQWQSNYPWCSTIFNYFSMKRPIMEAAAVTCFNAASEHPKPHIVDSIKTEDQDNTASVMTASSMASMAQAASCMFNRLQDTSNFTTG